jgi:hypothetical protein
MRAAGGGEGEGRGSGGRRGLAAAFLAAARLTAATQAAVRGGGGARGAAARGAWVPPEPLLGERRGGSVVFLSFRFSIKYLQTN